MRKKRTREVSENGMMVSKTMEGTVRKEVLSYRNRIENDGIDFCLKKGLIEGTLTVNVFSSQNGREKEDRIGESQSFPERALCVWDEVCPAGNRNRDLALTKYATVQAN
jgi:hypothetical protein